MEENKKGFTRSQTIGVTIVSIVLAVTTITMFFAMPNKANSLESIHDQAEFLRHEIQIKELQIGVLQARYKLEAHLQDFQ